MPHIVVKYSKELENTIDIPKMLSNLHSDLADRDSIALDALKTYALPINFCEVGLLTTKNSMVHVILKLLPGRTLGLKSEMSDGLNVIVREYVGDISVTVEVQELEAATYCK